ncbi:MAG: single-stranded-DNA-specific exonuclease RecJ [Desulfotalea sp.]
MKTTNPIYQLLEKRGYTEQEELEEFLNPKLSSLIHPNKMLGMKAAVAEILEAIKNENKIVIWGDYDVDGTTASALLVNTFSMLGIDTTWHIPNRLVEGYGLNCEYFEDLASSGISDFLLITVDCGISNVKEIERIKELGGRVIVTDHHQLPKKLPDCIYLNPSNEKCGLFQTHLAGVGVAFYLAAGLRSSLENGALEGRFKGKIGNLKSLLGFVALGTIADVVPLSQTNRLLTKAGFETFKENHFYGLRTLLESCGLASDSSSSDDIGFNLAPKINAAGRYGLGHRVTELLTTTDDKEAAKIALELTKLNQKRKEQCQSDMEQILDDLQYDNREKDEGLVVYGDYFEGIIGILASRLVDQYKVPTIVLTKAKDGNIKGSARSVEGVNLIEIINKCSHLLLKHGGHAMAAGLSLDKRNIESFTDLFKKEVGKLDFAKTSSFKFDLKCGIDDLFEPKILKLYQSLEPFGQLNTKPLFYDDKAEIVASRSVGHAKQHLQITLRGKYNGNIKAIAFNQGDKAGLAQSGDTIKIIYSASINRFGDKVSWQAQVHEIIC